MAVISRKDAQRELARRELARRQLLRFGEYVKRGFKIYPHQQLIADALMRVVEYVETRGKSGCGRLMVLMPPQHGKSLTAANLFPAWCLGKYPDWRFVNVSYNAKRAERNSKAVRDLINTPAYSAVFGNIAGRDDAVQLSSDSRGVSAWNLAQPHVGGMVSAGAVVGSITGYDAQVVIIDDPFAGREDAESQAQREKVIDWYESQVYTRQQDGMAIILFHTRWNPGDLAGHLIREMVENPKADQWEIVCLPGLALDENEYPANEEAQREMMRDGIWLPLADPLGRAPGEALCPQMTSRELLENIRDNMSLHNFFSLFQQMPFMRSGGMFKRSWFKIESSIPEAIKFVRSVWYWDNAAKSDSGDYGAGVFMAVDQFDRYWVLDVVRDQYSTFERRQAMKNAWLKANARFGKWIPAPPQLWHPQDPGSAGLDSARDTNKFLAGLPAHFEPVSGDKETRADPWSSALEADNVVLLKGGWNQAFINEHLSFPKGLNDDQVDAASSAYVKLSGGITDSGMVAYAKRKLQEAQQKKAEQEIVNVPAS